MGKTRNIELSFNNGTGAVVFSVNPQKLTATRPHIVKKYMTVDGYELAVNAGAGLRRVVFETFLPSAKMYADDAIGFKHGLDIIWMLHDWQNSRKPVRLKVSDTDIIEAFLIEDMTETFYEGDKDVWLKLSLCEYRFPRTKSLVTDRARVEEYEVATKPSTYVIKQGDTLWALSKRFLGDPLRWRELKDKNNIADERKLSVGMVIYL